KEGGYMREFIGIGVVVSLALIASAAAIHYFHGKKASTAVVQKVSSRAVNNPSSSPISASRETQKKKVKMTPVTPQTLVSTKSPQVKLMRHL
ncbi:hypothetical protein RRG08_046506, partial [Elysia crispata]